MCECNALMLQAIKCTMMIKITLQPIQQYANENYRHQKASIKAHVNSCNYSFDTCLQQPNYENMSRNKSGMKSGKSCHIFVFHKLYDYFIYFNFNQFEIMCLECINKGIKINCYYCVSL